MKCANCKNDSLFEYRLTHKVSLYYCEKHVPKFLEERKRANLIGTTEAFDKAKEEAAEILASVPAAPVVEVVEEPVEEPKPKKKSSKKKKAETE